MAIQFIDPRMLSNTSFNVANNAISSGITDVNQYLDSLRQHKQKVELAKIAHPEAQTFTPEQFQKAGLNPDLAAFGKEGLKYAMEQSKRSGEANALSNLIAERTGNLPLNPVASVRKATPIENIQASANPVIRNKLASMGVETAPIPSPEKNKATEAETKAATATTKAANAQEKAAIAALAAQKQAEQPGITQQQAAQQLQSAQPNNEPDTELPANVQEMQATTLQQAQAIEVVSSNIAKAEDYEIPDLVNQVEDLPPQQRDAILSQAIEKKVNEIPVVDESMRGLVDALTEQAFQPIPAPYQPGKYVKSATDLDSFFKLLDREQHEEKAYNENRNAIISSRKDATKTLFKAANDAKVAQQAAQFDRNKFYRVENNNYQNQLLSQSDKANAMKHEIDMARRTVGPKTLWTTLAPFLKKLPFVNDEIFTSLASGNEQVLKKVLSGMVLTDIQGMTGSGTRMNQSIAGFINGANASLLNSPSVIKTLLNVKEYNSDVQLYAGKIIQQYAKKIEDPDYRSIVTAKISEFANDLYEARKDEIFSSLDDLNPKEQPVGSLKLNKADGNLYKKTADNKWDPV